MANYEMGLVEGDELLLSGESGNFLLIEEFGPTPPSGSSDCDLLLLNLMGL